MPLEPLIRPWLAPLAWLYGAGRIAHRALFTSGLLKSNRLPKPVICVGNVSVGGTGKTPFNIMLANELISRGLRPCVLSRGYRAEPPASDPRVVSDGKGMLLGAAESGDEPLLIARSCPGVPVVICSNRYAAGMLAIERFNPDLFLLDDGFQHEALARNSDIVLWDVRDDPARERQLPAGRLREGVSALRRATAIILTHAEYLASAEREGAVRHVREHIAMIAPGVPMFEAAAEIGDVVPLGGISESSNDTADRQPDSAGQAGAWRSQRIALLSGIARPDGFEALVRAAGATIVLHTALADHAHYTRESVEAIVQQSVAAGAELVLTTEKDAVKLLASGADLSLIRAARLRMAVIDPARWHDFLDQLLKRIGSDTPPPPKERS